MDKNSRQFESHEDEEKYRQYLGLVLAHQSKLNAFILCMVPLHQDAQDILQDTLLEMWIKYDQYREGTNFLAWGISIARFKIQNYRRKKKNSKVKFSDALLDIIQKESQERVLDIEARIDSLKECVRKLSPKETKLLRLRYQDDLTFREISNIYGYSHQAICKAMSVIHSRLVHCINSREVLS